MLKTLGQLKVSQVGKEWRVNEVTKGKRELFRALGAETPATGAALVIEEPGV